MSREESWPQELRVNPARDTLTVTFDAGEQYQLAAEYLRVESPSAEVQGHRPSERQYIAGKRRVKIMRIDMVGRYAARIIFDDGHDSGLYTWNYLRELGREHHQKWENYLQGLAGGGLSRD